MSGGRIGANIGEMQAARRGLGQARASLSGLAAGAGGVSVPSHPPGLASQIRSTLAATSATARSAEGTLTATQFDLARRELAFIIADTLGSFTPLNAGPDIGSGEVAGSGIIPDEWGARLAGIQESLDRYSRILKSTTHAGTLVERVDVRGFRRRADGTIEWFTRQVERRTPTTITLTRNLRWASQAAKAAKFLGRVGHVDTALAFLDAVKKPKREVPAAIGGATGGAIGAWGGGLVGAKVGGATGAAIGTFFFPGVGTAVGGAIGAGIGAVGGAFAGSQFGKKIGEHVGEGARDLAIGAKKAADAAGRAIGDVGDKVGDKLGDAKNALGSAKDKIGNLFG